MFDTHHPFQDDDGAVVFPVTEWILGGNIAGRTRNITTAIALKTSRGEFAFAMALGVILLCVALGANFRLRFLQGRGEAQ